MSRYKYVDILPLIIERYNDSPHRALFGRTPHKVYREGRTIKPRESYRAILSNPVFTKKLLKVGQRVRVSRTANSTFEKSSLRQWVNEVFKIDKVFITDPPTYRLIDDKGETITGVFYREELQEAK